MAVWGYLTSLKKGDSCPSKLKNSTFGDYQRGMTDGESVSQLTHACAKC